MQQPDGKNSLHILTINSGSSSVKFSLFQIGASEQEILAGSLERIGQRGGLFSARDAQGEKLQDRRLELKDHDAAFQTLFDWLKEHAPDQELDATGHRIVHGGAEYTRPHAITPKMLATLKDLVPLAPDHLPHEIKAIQAVSRIYPELEQVACFDTSFHRQMPEIAQLYALPRSLWHAGVRRYGFHGLSYEYIITELRKEAGERAAKGRVIIAHLGNGASMAAVRTGKSVDTTMGYTPTGGLVMSTRTGDLDPGVVLYLLEERGMRASSVNDMLNQYSGLLGVSGVSSDMKDLLEKEQENPQAAEAIQLFCYQAKKFLGAFVAVLGGLDTLVFTAGIGENAPAIRERICDGLQSFGIQLDRDRNQANAPVISSEGAPVTVRVMKTNEELMIARHTCDVISSK
jgi:acetate kinase